MEQILPLKGSQQERKSIYRGMVLMAAITMGSLILTACNAPVGL